MWNLTEEQALIGESAEKLLDSDYGFEARKGRIESADAFDRALWQQFADLGWLGIAFDEMDGGYGGGTAELALLMHRFGRKLVVEPFLATVMLGGTLVARGAERATRSKLVQGLRLERQEERGAERRGRGSHHRQRADLGRRGRGARYHPVRGAA